MAKRRRRFKDSRIPTEWTIKTKAWRKYTDSLRLLSDKASGELEKYIHAGHTEEETLEVAHALVTKYGEASSELACQMYEALAEYSGAAVAAADAAATATYGETARAIRGEMLRTRDAKTISSAAGRLVKLASVDTMTKNALRDGAEWAWIPSGDTCPYCLMLASRGWQRASEDIIKNGHATHVHNNCDCTFAVRLSDNVNVEGYDPDALYDEYINAGDTQWERINTLRRRKYAENREYINAQKRLNYARKTGALYGAYNDINDPFFEKRERIGKDLYTEISNRKRSYEIKAVADNSGFREEDIDTVFSHIFEKEHLFEDGSRRKFDPDYYMAQSWLRLREGKNIQEHDLILLHHELEEARIMDKNVEIPYEKAHNEVEKRWNYKKALMKYLETHEA